MLRYIPVPNNYESDALGEYISFDIHIINEDNDILLSISDVSTNENLVSDLCNLCNAGQLDPIHIYDVIEDTI